MIDWLVQLHEQLYPLLVLQELVSPELDDTATSEEVCSEKTSRKRLTGGNDENEAPAKKKKKVSSNS